MKFKIEYIFGGYKVVAASAYPKTKKAALKASIQKWEFVVRHAEAFPGDDWLDDSGTESCPLCQLYIESNKGGCSKCPIGKDGHIGCENTPYDIYLGDPNDAQKEVDYLKDLYKRLYGEEYKP